MRFKNWKISDRLLAGFGLMLALQLGMAVFYLLRMEDMQTQVNLVVDQDIPRLETSSDWTVRLLENARHTRNMLILENPADVQREIDMVGQENRVIEGYARQMKEAALAPELQQALDRILAARDTYLPLEQQYIRLVLAGDARAAKEQLLTQTRPAQLAYRNQIKAFYEAQRAITRSGVEATHADYLAGRRIVLALLALALVLGLGSAWIIIVSVRRRTETAYRHLKEMTEGNLAVEVALDVQDEITRILQMVARIRDKLLRDLEEARRTDALKALMLKVQTASVQIGNAIAEVAVTARQQEASSMEMAATTTQISVSSKEISTNATELVKTMDEVSGVAEQTATLAGSGQAGLTHMEDTMRQVMEAAGAINAKLTVLSDKASNINQVTSTINKVADQTNLLSLNAAIEAEKAGEFGRGFAVVAAEIRRLADQTAVATYDIELIVKEIQSAVSASVMGMDKFSEEVRRGLQEVQRIGASLAQVIGHVQALAPRFENVNEGMQSQAVSAQQITEALAQLSEAVQQTVDSIRQSTQAIGEVNQAMHDLTGDVTREPAA